MSSLEGLGLRSKIVNEPTLIRKVFIPDTAHQIGIGGHPIFRELCSRIGADILKWDSGDAGTLFKGERVYLSRACLSSNRRRIVGELELEQNLRERGFRVVHPERLPFREQIALYSRAQTVVGCIGSAFHVQIFSPQIRPQVICITNEKPSLTFFNFDAMCETRSIYVLGLSKSRFRLKYVKHEILSVEATLDAIDSQL